MSNKSRGVVNITDTSQLRSLLADQRTAFLREGAPSLTQRKADLTKFRAAIIGHRKAIEDAINADFGHRSRHETAVMEVAGVAEGTNYLIRNLARFMAPARRHVSLPFRPGKQVHQHMTTETSLPLRGSCDCGACSFDVHTSPKGRFRCHCLICQAFNGKPFADVVAVRAKDVLLKNAGNISFKKYRPPPNFSRGVCRTCGKPVVEVAGLGPFKVMFIPASNFEPTARLPPVRMDIFYHRRVQDMPDGPPKHSGYFSSELAVGKMIIGGL